MPPLRWSAYRAEVAIMMEEPAISAIAHSIQLSVAPVFLLSGIGGMLAVMTARLSRIVDRARVIEAKAEAHSDGAAASELAKLSRRARLISYSIGLCTLTALLIASVIALLFLSAFVTFDASVAVAVLFVSAMLVFILALLGFLREVLMASASVRFGRR
jgi:hypothetical protein